MSDDLSERPWRIAWRGVEESEIQARRIIDEMRQTCAATRRHLDLSYRLLRELQRAVRPDPRLPQS